MPVNNGIDDEKDDGIQEEKPSFAEYLAMFDKINKCYFLNDESHKMLSTVTRKLKNFQLANKKKFDKITLNLILLATFLASLLKQKETFAFHLICLFFISRKAST